MMMMMMMMMMIMIMIGQWAGCWIFLLQQISLKSIGASSCFSRLLRPCVRCSSTGTVSNVVPVISN